MLHPSDAKTQDSHELLKQQLSFLQRVFKITDSSRNIMFCKKSTMLRIFARWCKRNSGLLNLQPWECLTKEMTLFDVVYLDVADAFDLPVTVLLGYVDKEWPIELVCKLAICYSINESSPNNDNIFKNPIHSKTLLIIQRALKNKYPTLETIIVCLSFLIKCNQHEIARRVLQKIDPEMLRNDVIYFHRIFITFVSEKTKKEIQDLPPTHDGHEPTVSASVYICFLLSLCYKQVGDDARLDQVVLKMRRLATRSNLGDISISRCF